MASDKFAQVKRCVDGCVYYVIYMCVCCVLCVYACPNLRTMAADKFALVGSMNIRTIDSVVYIYVNMSAKRI